MKLKDLLNQLKYQITPDKEALRANIIENYYQSKKAMQKKLIVILCGALIAVLITLALSLYMVNYFTFDTSRNIIGDTAQISKIVYVAADKTESDGSTALQSKITLVTSEKMSTTTLQDHLSVSPSIPYSLRKTGINRFSLQFEQALLPDQSYIIQSTVSDAIVYRWSMQTESVFSVAETSPAAKDFDVDVNTDITVTFSRSDVNALQSYFSIQPAAKGTFMHNGRTWIFRPESRLNPYTTYTVTISSDAGESEGHALGKDYTFSFTTGASDARYAYLSGKTYDIADHFTTADIPGVTITAKGMISNVADIQTYKLPSAETYLSLHQKYCQSSLISPLIENEIKNNDYDLYSQFSITAISDPEQSEKYHFRYPKEHEKGYYLSVIQWEDIKLYQLMQVHEYAAYATTYQNHYSVWVNQTENSVGVTNATVEINSQTAQTDENGMAVLSLSQKPATAGTYITITSENTIPYYLYIKNDNTFVSSTDYVAMLSIDKKTYSPNDTVKVWGAVVKRNTGAKAPVVTLKAHWNQQEYTVTLDKNGAFETTIPLNNVARSASRITLKINGNDYRSIPLSVSKTNHSVSLSATASKNAYFNGENINISFHANYENNIPVKDLTVQSGDFTAHTNENGKAELSIPATYVANSVSNCLPYAATTEFSSSLYKTQTNKQNLKHLIFNSKEYLNGELTLTSDKQATLRIQTNQISLDKINSLNPGDFYNMYDNIPTEYYLGAPIHKEISVEIHNVSYEREKIGNYYDPIQQKILLRYKYKEIDTVVENLSVATTVSDGTAIMDKLALPKTEGYRYLLLKMVDADGNECIRKIYIDPPINKGEGYHFKTETTQVNVGQTVDISVVDASAKQQIKDGRFICNVVDAQKLSSYTASQKLDLSFSEEQFPEVRVFGAYFDGKHIHEITPQSFSLRSDNKKINISITSEGVADHSNKLKLDIHTTDISGNPIPASFNLQIAHAYLTNAYANAFDTNIPEKINSTHSIATEETISTQSFTLPDCTQFICGTTDTSGNATIEITLAASAAPIHVFAKAVATDGYTGSWQGPITIKEDIRIFYNEFKQIHTGDDIALSFGIIAPKLSAEQMIESKISIYKDKDPVSEKIIAHQKDITQYLSLGKLPVGKYRLSISSSMPGGTEDIAFEFEVIDSSVVTTLGDFDTQISASGLLITDDSYRMLHALMQQSLQSANSRIDWFLAHQNTFAVMNGTNYGAEDVFEKFFKTNGMPMYIGGKENLLLNVRLASLFPEEYSKTVGVAYFDNILKQGNTTLTETLYALWGKAALHQAVEKDLNYYFAEGNGFTTEQYLCFALGFAYGGNQTKANEIFTDYLQGELTIANDTCFIRADEEVFERCNALLAQLAARLSITKADQILQYALKNDSDIALAGLSIVSYINEYVPALEGKNTLTLTFANHSAQTYSFDRLTALWIRFEDLNTNIVSIEQSEGINRITAITNRAAAVKQPKGLSITTPAAAALGEQISLQVNLDSLQHIRLIVPNGLHYLGQFSSNQVDTVVTTDDKYIDIFTNRKGNAKINLNCRSVLSGNFSIGVVTNTAGDPTITNIPIDIHAPGALPDAETEAEVADPALPQE